MQATDESHTLLHCQIACSKCGINVCRMSRVIFCGNLPVDVRTREVEDLFHKYGKIIEASQLPHMREVLMHTDLPSS